MKSWSLWRGTVQVEGDVEHRTDAFPARYAESAGAWFVEPWAIEPDSTDTVIEVRRDDERDIQAVNLAAGTAWARDRWRSAHLGRGGTGRRGAVGKLPKLSRGTTTSWSCSSATPPSVPERCSSRSKLGHERGVPRTRGPSVQPVPLSHQLREPPVRRVPSPPADVGGWLQQCDWTGRRACAVTSTLGSTGSITHKRHRARSLLLHSAAHPPRPSGARCVTMPIPGSSHRTASGRPILTPRGLRMLRGGGDLSSAYRKSHKRAGNTILS